MSKTSSQRIIVVLLVLGALAISAGSALAANGTWSFSANTGLNTTAGAIGYTDANATSPEAIVSNAINILLSFLGVVFLGLMIYAGLSWMLAAGNEQSVDKAKRIIEDAAIGLIVVLAAYAIAYFVLQYFAATTLS